MEQIKQLFWKTRSDRLWFQQANRFNNGKYSIEAAACAIRERALLDALLVLGLSTDEAMKMEKIE